MAETVVVDFNFGDAFGRLAQINKAIKELNDDTKELSETTDVYGNVTQEAAEAIEINNASTRALKKERSELQRVTDASIKQEKAQKGSIEANRAELSRLKAEYIKLANPTKAQTKQIADLTDGLKEQEAAIGVTSRNVGNYQDAVKGGIESTGIFSRELGVLNNISKTLGGIYQQQTNAIRVAVKDYKAATTSTEALTVAQKAGTAATAGATLGLKALKVALVSTGVGALVIGLGSLVTFLTQTQKGLDIVNKAGATLSATFDVFKDRAATLGESIFTLGKRLLDPKQAIIDLGNAIKDNVLNRFKALGVLGSAISKILSGELKEGFKELADGAIQLGTGVTEATDKIADGFKGAVDGAKALTEEIQQESKAAGDLAQRSIELTKAQADLEVQFAKTREEVKELNKIAEDTTKSEDERTKAAQRAIDIEKGLLNERLKLAKEEVAITKERNALGISTEADIQKERDAEIKLANIRTESLELQTTLQNKLNTITASGEKPDEATSAYKKLNEEITALKDKALEEFITQGDTSAETLQEIVDKSNELTTAQKALEAAINKTTTATDDQNENLNALKEGYEQDNLALQQALFNKEITQQEFNERFKEGQLTFLEGTIQELEAQLFPLEASTSNAFAPELTDERKELLLSQLSDYYDQANDLRTEQVDAEADSFFFLEDTQRQVLDSRLGGVKTVTKGLQENFSEGSAAYKSFAVANATIDTIQGAIAAYRSLAGIPLVGPALGATAAAAFAAFGALNIKKILSTNPQKKADGGPVEVGGDLHSEGGTTYVGEDGNAFEVERGEDIFVLNRRAAQARRLGIFNQMYGGDPWTKSTRYAQAGGVIPQGPSFDGGFTARQAGIEATQSVALSEALRTAVTDLEPVVKVTDINRVNAETTQGVAVSDLG